MSPLLNVRNLEIRFPSRQGEIHAVNRISFQLQAGETLGMVGESGSGKSVTLLSVLGLLPAPGRVLGGEILFEGRDLLTLSRPQIRQVRGNRIGMIFQDPMTSLNPVLTIGRQLTESLRAHLHLSPPQAKIRALELLHAVGIPAPEQRIRQFPHQFSGGMRQRVMIAMGLACHPQLLIADEPTTALDVTIQAQIVRLVKQLRQDTGTAIIWITHDLALLAGLAQRILVMYAGQIVEQASIDELYDQPRHPYTIGLLQSLPRLDDSRRQRLSTIPGLPPSLIHYPEGCPFAPRCPFVMDRCWQDNPPLEPVSGDHQVACWVKPERSPQPQPLLS